MRPAPVRDHRLVEHRWPFVYRTAPTCPAPDDTLAGDGSRSTRRRRGRCGRDSQTPAASPRHRRHHAADARATRPGRCPAAAPAVGRADGWGARQIRKGGVRARDRDLAASLPGRARLGYHPETGRVRFISGTPAVPLSAPVSVAGDRAASNSPAPTRSSKARRFVERYGAALRAGGPGARAARARPSASSATSAQLGAESAQPSRAAPAAERHRPLRPGDATAWPSWVARSWCNSPPTARSSPRPARCCRRRPRPATQPRVPASRAPDDRSRVAGSRARPSPPPRSPPLRGPRASMTPDSWTIRSLAPTAGTRLVWRIDARVASRDTAPASIASCSSMPAAARC